MSGTGQLLPPGCMRDCGRCAGCPPTITQAQVVMLPPVEARMVMATTCGLCGGWGTVGFEGQSCPGCGGSGLVRA